MDDELKRIARVSGRRIAGSRVFLALLTDNFERDPKAVLELGIAILLDKPIFLFCQEGTKVSEHVKKVAKQIEYYNPNDEVSYEAAKARIAEHVIRARAH